MKDVMENIIMKLIVLLIGMAIVFQACSKINQTLGLKDDNIIEEKVEDAIESKLGLDVDLTPSSRE